MNPFFWFLVLAAAVVLWFALRKAFIWVGGKFWDIAEDTKNILTYEASNTSEHEGENNNA